MSNPIRLSKAVAQHLQCSRQHAELLIESGCVRVQGQVVEIPEHRVPADPLQWQIQVAENAKPQLIAPVTIVYFKPSGQPCWEEDPAQDSWMHAGSRSGTDRSGVRLLRKHLKGLVCVSPLEVAASGLVVFTQDPRMARKLVADAALVENEVMVEVEGLLSGEQILALERGHGARRGASTNNPPPFKVSMTSQGDHTTGLRFALKGNQPGRLAAICQAQQLTIVAMKRQRIGRVGLTGLALGQWRFLLPYERF